MPSNNPHPERNLTADGRAKGGRNSSGNFKHDPNRAAMAGRKGGQARRPNSDESVASDSE